MNRLTNGRKDKKTHLKKARIQVRTSSVYSKTIRKNSRKKIQVKTRNSYSNTIRNNPRKKVFLPKLKGKMRLAVKRASVLAALLICFGLIASKTDDIKAYFIDYHSISNIFSINAEYTVTFNSNTGTGTMTSQSISYNVATALTNNSYTKAGYTFAGWNTEADGTGTGYANGEEVTNLGNTTLYAQWKDSFDVKYAVQIYGINEDLDENGNPLGLTFGPALGANYNNSYVTHEYEQITGNPGNYYVKIVTHTVAANGTESANSEYLYEDGGTTTKVTRTTAEKNKYDVNIHNMTWEQIANEMDKTKFLDCMLCGDTKSVELSLNSTIGSGSTYNQYGDGTGVLHNTIEEYYRGWNPSYDSAEFPERNNSAATNGGSSGSNAKSAGGYSTSHIRATFIGENSKTDVTYAGDVNLTTATCLYSCIESDLRNVITAKVVKYATEEQGNDKLNTDISDKIWCLSRAELFHWGSDLEGIGTNGSAYGKFTNNESKYYLGGNTNDSTVKRSAYQEDGQTHLWWLRSSNMYTTFISDASNGNGAWGSAYSFETLETGLGFGFCLQGEHQVSFNSNGGTGTMGNQSISNNVPTKLTENVFSKAGYSFSGWNTEEDGTGTSYTDEEEVTNLGNITLYAQWETAYGLKYAVQIYGINEDVDENDNPIGLTFGPASEGNYNNAYVTHEYEAITGNPGNYYVKIVTHTVAANGTETENSEYLYKNGGTTTKVTRTTAEKDKYDINMHEMTWEEIAEVPDKTDFLDCMLCGDTKSVEISLNSTIANPTTFTNYGDGTNLYQYGDGSGTIGYTINRYYGIWNPSYNYSDQVLNNPAVGTGTPFDPNTLQYGLNARNAGGYSSSHLRATLIGENSKTHTGYAGDVNLKTYNSLYSCLPMDLKHLIVAKKVRYATGENAASYRRNDDIIDKIWALSQREVYSNGEYNGWETDGLGANGDGYSKFGNEDSKYYVSSYNPNEVEQRICYGENGSEDYYWLRSPGFDWDHSACVVTIDGGIGGFVPNYDLSLAFGFCIGNPSITSYSITYNLDGGTTSQNNLTIYNNQTETFTLNNPTKAGYTFVGWSGTDLVGTNNTTVTITKGSTGNRTYTANWVKNIEIGDTINYSTSMNGVTLNNWKVFNIDGDYTTLIYGDYLPTSAIDFSSNEFSKLSQSPSAPTYGLYVSYDFTREELLEAIETKSNWDSLLTGTINGNPVNLTRTTNIWAMGSPTIDLWVDSWNAEYPSDTIYTAQTQSPMSDGLTGHYVGWSQNPYTVYIEAEDIQSKTGYNNELYYPYHNAVDYCWGYWLASAASDSIYCLMAIDCTGSINRNGFGNNDANNSVGFRPVITLPSSILSQ